MAARKWVMTATNWVVQFGEASVAAEKEVEVAFGHLGWSSPFFGKQKQPFQMPKDS